MKYQFFTIPVHAPDSAQDTLNRFCAGHRIVTMDKQFIADGQRSFWAMCVAYLSDNDVSTSRKGKIDYWDVLDEKDFRSRSHAPAWECRLSVEVRGMEPVY